MRGDGRASADDVTVPGAPNITPGRASSPHVHLEPADAKIDRPWPPHEDARLHRWRRLEDVHTISDGSPLARRHHLLVEACVDPSSLIRDDVAHQFDPSRRLDLEPHPNIRVRRRHHSRSRDDDPSWAVVPDDATVGRQAGAGMQPHLCRQVRATQARVDAVDVRLRLVGPWSGNGGCAGDWVGDGERRDGGVERRGQ